VLDSISDLNVLALPRGGVPVAYEVARAFHAPLDVFLVRKLGVPGHEELAMGAIASGGIRILNPSVIQALGISSQSVNAESEIENAELIRRERLYRPGLPPLELRGKTVLLIDDGLATGASMRAAIRAIRTQSPRALVVAVPVGSRETCEDLRRDGINLLCLESPPSFGSVGEWYLDFSQVTDEAVIDFLRIYPETPSERGFGIFGESRTQGEGTRRRPSRAVEHADD
jgi:predicted phosphoribosyltransferase